MLSAFYILEKACSRHSSVSVHECAFTFTENVWQQYRPSSDDLFSLSSGEYSKYFNDIQCHTYKQASTRKKTSYVSFLELLSKNV